MKKILLAFCIIVSFSSHSVFAQADTVYTIGSTLISFDKTTFDFGVINFDSDTSCTFTFTNTGNMPLTISYVKSSCGCTVPEWTQDAVAPGKTGTIKVKYNTKRSGKFEKGITIYSNAANTPLVLKIMGEVTPNPNKARL